MKVLVTGAAGLLGRYVTRRLLARGDRVLGVDSLSRYEMMGERKAQDWPADFLSVANLDLMRAPFDSSDALASASEWGPDAVIHAAANTSHPLSILKPTTDFEVNAAGTLRLLEFLRGLSRPPRFVNIGSAKVYDMAAHTPSLIEEPTRFRTIFPKVSVTEEWPVGGFITPFGVSKLAAEMYVHNYARLYALDACTIRPGCFTGAGSLACEMQNWAPVLARAVARGDPFRVYGYGGRQVRDLLHADDLARLVLLCLDRKGSWRGEVMNACGGHGRDVSVLEAATAFERLLGRRAELLHEAQREADWSWFVGGNYRAMALVNWEPEITLEAILTELAEEARHG